MPLEETIRGKDPCELARRWTVDELVMRKVVAAAEQFWEETRIEPWILSGYRTPAEQNRLRRQGRPTADNDKSTHLSCPATGVDIRLGFGVTRPVKATWVRIATVVGLRVGGGGPVDSGGLPVDWNHVDIGPRRNA